VEVQGKLESSGPFGAMCTHRITIESVEQIDEERACCSTPGVV